MDAKRARWVDPVYVLFLEDKSRQNASHGPLWLLPIFRPGTAGFPNTDLFKTHAGPERVTRLCPDDVGAQTVPQMLKHGLREHFRRRIQMFKPDDPIPIHGLKMRVLGVVGVHAKRMVVLFQKISDEAFDDFKVADHLVCIEGISRKNTFHFPRVTVGKTAFIGVLRKHVPVLNFERFADTESHEINALIRSWRRRG